MPGIVPAILELGGRMLENLSTASLMRYITDRTIRKEKVFFVLLCDFFYAIFLLMGYRLNVEFVLSYRSVDGPEQYRENNYISTSTMGIAGYFLVKELMTLLSLYLTSKKLAKRYCSSVFNIIDVASVALLLGSEAALTTDPSFLDNEGFAASLTIILVSCLITFSQTICVLWVTLLVSHELTPLSFSLSLTKLWLKSLGEYRVLNSAFALFLYAVNEVIKEIKWFILFLMTVTLMFSDAARTGMSQVHIEIMCFNINSQQK